MKLTLSDCTSLCQKGHQGDAFSGLIEQTAADANGQVQRWLLYAQEAREGGRPAEELALLQAALSNRAE